MRITLLPKGRTYQGTRQPRPLTSPRNLPAPAAGTHTLKVPHPRGVPDEGVAETREAPSNEGAFFIGPNR